METLRLITGSAHPALAGAIAERLGKELCKVEVGRFPDGETKVRILEDVRGTDAFIMQPVGPPQNDHLVELLILIDAARRASADRITAVIPYYSYARQDRKHEGRVPITAKLVANLITVAGASRVLTMDLHATQIQGFFDIPLDHLFAAPVLVDHLKQKRLQDLVVMAPDPGSVRMANAFARMLGGGIAFMDKRRVSDTEVESLGVVGDIAGKNAVIVDDMITTAGSMAEAIAAAKRHGARSVMAAATHAVFVGSAPERLSEAGPDEIVVTDTIPLSDGGRMKDVKLTVLSVAPLLAEAIQRIHRNKSVSSLFV